MIDKKKLSSQLPISKFVGLDNYYDLSNSFSLDTMEAEPVSLSDLKVYLLKYNIKSKIMIMLGDLPMDMLTIDYQTSIPSYEYSKWFYKNSKTICYDESISYGLLEDFFSNTGCDLNKYIHNIWIEEGECRFNELCGKSLDSLIRYIESLKMQINNSLNKRVETPQEILRELRELSRIIDGNEREQYRNIRNLLLKRNDSIRMKHDNNDTSDIEHIINEQMISLMNDIICTMVDIDNELVFQ